MTEFLLACRGPSLINDPTVSLAGTVKKWATMYSAIATLIGCTALKSYDGLEKPMNVGIFLKHIRHRTDAKCDARSFIIDKVGFIPWAENEGGSVKVGFCRLPGGEISYEGWALFPTWKPNLPPGFDLHRLLTRISRGITHFHGSFWPLPHRLSDADFEAAQSAADWFEYVWWYQPGFVAGENAIGIEKRDGSWIPIWNETWRRRYKTDCNHDYPATWIIEQIFERCDIRLVNVLRKARKRRIFFVNDHIYVRIDILFLNLLAAWMLAASDASLPRNISPRLKFLPRKYITGLEGARREKWGRIQERRRDLDRNRRKKKKPTASTVRFRIEQGYTADKIQYAGQHQTHIDLEVSLNESHRGWASNERKKGSPPRTMLDLASNENDWSALQIPSQVVQARSHRHRADIEVEECLNRRPVKVAQDESSMNGAITPGRFPPTVDSEPDGNPMVNVPSYSESCAVGACRYCISVGGDCKSCQHRVFSIGFSDAAQSFLSEDESWRVWWYGCPAGTANGVGPARELACGRRGRADQRTVPGDPLRRIVQGKASGGRRWASDESEKITVAARVYGRWCYRKAATDHRRSPPFTSSENSSAERRRIRWRCMRESKQAYRDDGKRKRRWCT
ncbi:hypothetical protein FB451DRAFT_1192819 [Mycena latifolia]|nr:hypothetical protein FB451DRAFT_1192819 [Mycena latifolia]